MKVVVWMSLLAFIASVVYVVVFDTEPSESEQQALLEEETDEQEYLLPSRRKEFMERASQISQQVAALVTKLEEMEDKWTEAKAFGIHGAVRFRSCQFLRAHRRKQDENYYTGKKNDNNQRHGMGVLALPNGDFYVGSWKNDVRHGLGKTVTGYSVMDVQEEYITEWRFDEPHGLGRYKTGDGYIYEGEFKFGRQDGFGVFTWKVDGTEDAQTKAQFFGEWKSGQRNGHGIYEDDAVIHEGTWVEGKREGLARVTLKKNENQPTVFKLFKDDKMLDSQSFLEDYTADTKGSPQDGGLLKSLKQLEEEAANKAKPPSQATAEVPAPAQS